MGLLDRLRQFRGAHPPPDDDIDGRARALVVHGNEFGYDPFGLSRDSFASAAKVARWIYRSYFRASAFGVEHIPATGRVIFVANHSGQLPFDGLVIASAAFLEPQQPRLVRSMVEYFVPSVPFASYLFSRWGQITGTPENCRRLLASEEAVLVFPEGARGISKPFSRRYQLADFGKGFMRLALEMQAPVVPVAVIGAEEQAPAVNLKPLARLFRAPSFPIVPYPPFVPLVPLPVKYRVYFGDPMRFAGDPDDDDDVLDAQVKTVKNRIQSMLHVGLREREHVFW
ncbi:MAG: acyltransferase family protein [Deltaproteobacteria bacterium]|nr:acyltransferase family protein [Deltaproteobacteria bacterium]MCW5803293.1 acyltransferase family protein [Deltaproteobacteria bacterium]